MSDEEGYDSAEDQDYVPTDGEEVSEEENSGDEENLDLLKDDAADVEKVSKKRKPAKKSNGPRKRKGGIKLADEENTTVKEDKDDFNKELEAQIRMEQEQKKEDQQKKKAEDLWSSFMADVGPKKTPPRKTSTGGLGALSTSISKPATSSLLAPVKTPEVASKAAVSGAIKPHSTITVTKEYDFAGESVKVTKQLDVNSKEGKAELKRQEEEKQESMKPEAATASSPSGLKRPGGGLGGVLEKINKKPKLGTLEKSKLDWEAFKAKEGIDEELKIHNRGKESYIERMNFLQRSDHRQFEIEKNLRLNTSKR